MIRAETLEEAIEVVEYAGEGVMVENCDLFGGRTVMIGKMNFDELIHFSQVSDPEVYEQIKDLGDK